MENHLFIDEEAHIASVNGHEFYLAKQEFDALALLFKSSVRVVRFGELIDVVWPDDGSSIPRRNDVHHLMYRVKQRLEPFGLERAIQNVRNIGYRYRPLKPC